MKLMSASQAATETGKPVATIRWNIRKGFLKAQDVGGRWLINSDDLKTWVETPRPLGRKPRKAETA